MYEKHIDTLRIMIGKCGTDGQVEAINAAIALMRAAEPKDEAAERDRFQQLVNDVIAGRDMDAIKDDYAHDRAAARAEGYSAGRLHRYESLMSGLDEVCGTGIPVMAHTEHSAKHLVEPTAAENAHELSEGLGPVEVVHATAASLRADLLALARTEGFASIDALGEAIESGSISADSWTAWEFRGLSRLLAAADERAVK